MHSKNIIAEKVGATHNDQLESLPDGNAILWRKSHKRPPNGMAEFGIPIPKEQVAKWVSDHGMMACNGKPAE